MQKIQNIAVVSSSFDVIELTQLDKRFLKNLTVLATNLEAVKALEKSHFKFDKLDALVNKKTEKVAQNQATFVLEAVLNNPTIAKIFTVDTINLLEIVSNKLYLYLIRMILGYLYIEKMEKTYGKINLILFKNNVFSKYNSLSPSAFYSLVFYIWAKNQPKFKIKLISGSGRDMSATIISNMMKNAHVLSNFLLNVRENYKSSQREAVFVLPAAHAVKLIKLFKEMVKEKINYILIVHNLNISEKIILIKNNIRFIDRESLNGKVIEEHSLGLLLKIKTRWYQHNTNLNFLKPDTDRDKYLEDAISYRVEVFIKSELKQILKDLLISQKSIQRYKPKIIITTTDPDAKVFPFIHQAQLKNIETITIQHGAYALPGVVDFKSDKIFLWGKYYKSWFKNNLNKNNRQLIVTGSPFYDNAKVKAPQTISAGSKKKYSILILLSGAITNSVEKELENILVGVAKLTVKKIYVRTHPWQNIYIDPNITSSGDNNLIVVANKMDLKYYLDKSQVVITTNTAAGFRALIRGKIIEYWDFVGNEALPYRNGGIPVAKNSDEVLRINTKLLVGGYKINIAKRTKLIGDIFYKLDNNSSKRIVNYLKRNILSK